MIYLFVMLCIIIFPSAAFYGCYAWADRYQSATCMNKAERERRERDDRYAKMFRRV